VVVPAEWWRPAVVVSAASSGVPFVIYLGPQGLIPMFVDAVPLWRVRFRGWSVQGKAGV
jgi:hypothetical protein